MEKFKLIIKEQTFTFEDVEDLKRKVRSIMEIGVWAIETKSIKEDPKDSVQTIKPVIIDPKIDPKIVKLARKGVPEKKQKRKRGASYPAKLVDFVRKRMDKLNNSDLCEEINEEFDLDINNTKLSKWMYSKGLKRKKRVRTAKKIKKVFQAPERTQTGKIKPSRKKLFSEEVDDFIKKNWENKKDSDLRLMIGEEFGKFFTVDQIKAHRRQIDCVSDTPGRKKEKKEEKPEPARKSIEQLQETYETDGPEHEEEMEGSDLSEDFDDD